MKSFLLAGVAVFAVGIARAGTTQVAVAANFTDAAKAIGAAFTAETGHEAVFSFGSTGQLYTQITQGAPFDALLSADDIRPAKAVADGLGEAGSVFTYAIGQLALWSAEPGLVDGPGALQDPDLTRIAIANPKTAPYGAAAVQAMQKLGVYDSLLPKIVQGDSITQTFQFVATRNAEVGFVALSQVVSQSDGSLWLVDPSLYDPIRQDAVLLSHGAGNPAARAFLDFLKGETASAIIAGFGYARPAPG